MTPPPRIPLSRPLIALLALAALTLAPPSFARTESGATSDTRAVAHAPAIAAEPRPPATSPLAVNIVGAGAGQMAIELVFPSPVVHAEIRREAEGAIVVAVDAGEPPRLPWLRKELGAALVRTLVLRQTRDGAELVIAPGEGHREHGLTQDGRAIRVTLRGERPGSTLAASRALGSQTRAMRVVIDPGHGGSEEGAVGASGLKEKDVSLDIARRLSALLAAEGFEVHLTRSGDEDLSLDDRAALANEKRADLFVSLHVNASTHTRARGAETFFLAREATDDESRTIAALENGAYRGSSGSSAGSGELPLILWDLAQVEHLESSAELAALIQDRLDRALDMRNRGVRQAPFRVLVGATCPAVLVETGFMSNPEEEKLLATPDYRRKLAETLAAALIEYRARGRLVDYPEDREGGAR